MSATNSNCVEVTFDNTTFDGTLDWSLYKGGDWSRAAETTIANNDTWTGCFDEPFDCVELRAFYVPSESERNDTDVQPPPYRANIHVVWNDTVWVEGWTPVSDAYNPYDVSVVWIGNECHKYSYNLCMSNPNTWPRYGENDFSNMWLLDVQLTTKVIDSPPEEFPVYSEEFPVYWRVYINFQGGWSNLLHDPFFRKYQSNTTYRSLSCIAYNDGCTAFGLMQDSAVASHPIIRVNGIIKTDRYTNCSHDLCNDGDIVTPLEGCESLSAGAIAGIVLAAVAGAAILYYVAADHIRRKRNERREEDARA